MAVTLADFAPCQNVQICGRLTPMPDVNVVVYCCYFCIRSHGQQHEETCDMRQQRFAAREDTARETVHPR